MSLPLSAGLVFRGVPLRQSMFMKRKAWSRSKQNSSNSTADMRPKDKCLIASSFSKKGELPGSESYTYARPGAPGFIHCTCAGHHASSSPRLNQPGLVPSALSPQGRTWGCRILFASNAPLDDARLNQLRALEVVFHHTPRGTPIRRILLRGPRKGIDPVHQERVWKRGRSSGTRPWA